VICPPGAACMVLSSPAPKNILFRISELAYCSSIPPRFSEGRIAVVTTREAGMRWTRMCLLTSGTKADGEIVWSWRLKAGAQVFRGADKLCERRRWQSARFTEEITYKP